MGKLRYPVGIESFEKLREGGYVYVDKTRYIHKLLEGGGYYFLARPRRFGKSLFLSTLKAYFEGKRELFEDLDIMKYDNDWQPHPIFYFNFVTAGKDPESLNIALEASISHWEEQFGKKISEGNFAQRFYGVIRRAAEQTGRKAVILIDEYDKTLVNTLHAEKTHEEIRSILQPVYSVLKAADSHIHFAMLTGVSRFSRLSIFSDINNLADISLEPQFGAICGITQQELERDFKDGINDLAEKRGCTYDKALLALKKNYDGYHFCEDCPDIYNPFSVLRALSSKKLGAYWFSSGTPKFLMQAIRDKDFFLPDFNTHKATAAELESSENFKANPIPMLFQAGYLTIVSYNERRKTYSLGIPNAEVEEGIFQQLIPEFSGRDADDTTRTINNFLDYVEEGKPAEFIKGLQRFLTGIPDHLSRNKPEVYFENNLYLIFMLMGYTVHAEYCTSDGRIDILIVTDDYLYIMELKLNGSAESALKQINGKNYGLQFEEGGRKIFKIGLSFSSATRNIESWVIEEG